MWNDLGNYWAIHPACVEDFARGDYRRRQARRRAVGGSSVLQALQGDRSNMEELTEFVAMSCVTVLTGFNNNLTPADIIAMLPLPQ